MQRVRPFVFAVLLLVVHAVAAAVPTAAAARLHKLFADDWEWNLRDQPERASQLGDLRFADRLTDYTPAAQQARRAHLRHSDARLRAIDRKALGRDDRLSYDLYRYETDLWLAFDALHGDDGVGEDWTLVGHLDGIHLRFSEAVANTRFDNAEAYRQYLARLAALPRQIGQVTAIARKSLAAGWVLPRITVEAVPGQLDLIAGDTIEGGSWYAPFKSMPPTIAAAEADALRGKGRALLGESVRPALAAFRRFIAEEYLPKARDGIAASELPHGKAYYTLLMRLMTSLPDPDAAQIHATGKREVARIHAAIDSIARAQGFEGGAVAFIRAVRAQPDQYYASGDELLAAYGALGKRIDPMMPTLFAELPRMPWGVVAAPPEQAGQAAYYRPGAADGSRAAFFVVDTSSPQTSAKFEMTAYLLHEAIPGHHLQLARAGELTNLPDFRRHAWYTAYGEGWALYAESLGEDLGLYADPLARLGRHTFEAWRAARLVVDTGIHALGWSRQQAIEYMSEATGAPANEVTAEIDRYIVWPGQALAYKIGEMTIQRLRREAAAALGARFDLRRFHNLLLDAGPLPLAVLERRVQDWVARGGR